mgnify:CR=1 FL=1
MGPIRPRYNGVYGRLFASPSLVIGLGRWGTEVCSTFFQQMSDSLAPVARGLVPDGGTTSLKGCFATLACIRDMDRISLPVEWADVVHAWSPCLDEVNDGYTDIEGDYASVAFWRVPRSSFVLQEQEFIRVLVPQLRDLLARVSSNSWQAGCRALGLREAGNLDWSRKWIIAVGSMFEPEVPLILERLRTLILDDVLHGEESQCHFLYVLDAGLPDAPASRNCVWVNCPASLIAQFLAGTTLVQPGPKAVAFYTTATSALGYGTPERDRSAVACGLLKSYLTTYLLAPRESRTPRWDTLSLSSIPPSATADRTAVHVEVALDLQNLPELLAQELLARWKKRLFGEQFQLTSCNTLSAWFNAWVDTLNDGQPAALDRDLLNQWFGAGLNPGQQVELDSFKYAVGEYKRRLLEELERASDREDLPANQALDDGILTVLRRWFGAKKAADPRIHNSRTDIPTDIVNAKITRCDELLMFLERLGVLLSEIGRLESIFQDRIYDEHFSSAQDSAASLLLSYRRIPLKENCPPFILQYLEASDHRVPDYIFQTLLMCSNSADLSRVLIRQLASLWQTYPARPEDADQRWEQIGLAQWLRSDPYLADAIARFAYDKLVPLWKAHPGRESNWDGFLTVFDYGVRPGGPPSEATTRALEALHRSWRAVHQEERKHDFGIRNHSAEIAFAPTQIHWESWPCFSGLALLWTDYPILGNGFRLDWNADPFYRQSNDWAQANPDRARLVPWPPSGPSGASAGSNGEL